MYFLFCISNSLSFSISPSWRYGHGCGTIPESGQSNNEIIVVAGGFYIELTVEFLDRKTNNWISGFLFESVNRKAENCLTFLREKKGERKGERMIERKKYRKSERTREKENGKKK